jgi:hypothetical protein
MNNNDLVLHIGKLYTTELGLKRIQRNLNLEESNIVKFCEKLILKRDARILRKGKN